MSGSACAFTTRSGTVLCCSRQVAIIRQSSLACPGNKRPVPRAHSRNRLDSDRAGRRRSGSRRRSLRRSSRLRRGRAKLRVLPLLKGHNGRLYEFQRARALRAEWSQRAMIPSPLLRRAVVAALAALAITWPGMMSGRAQAEPRDGFSRTSPSGSYLAARHAGGQRDVAAAASYYRAALRADPGNNELLGRTFLAVLANGEVDEVVKLAERVLQVDKNDRIARLVLGVRAIKQKQYPVARRELALSIRGPITDLAATLLSAWTMASPSEARQATDSIDKLAGADWYALFKDLHAALILDVAGQKKEAAKRFERAYKLDPKALRVVQSYGSFLSRQGNTADAVKVFAAFDEALPRHPLIVEATNELKAGKKLPLMVDTPQAGAAEVLYGLGAALGRHGGEDLGLIYLQLSLYLAPSHSLVLLSLGELYDALKKPELANKAYERVLLNSPLHRNAQIQLALNLGSLDRTDEAKASLEKVIAANPSDLEAIMALGDILRGRKQFAECADVYSKGVDTIGKPEKSN